VTRNPSSSESETAVCPCMQNDAAPRKPEIGGSSAKDSVVVQLDIAW